MWLLYQKEAPVATVTKPPGDGVPAPVRVLVKRTEGITVPYVERIVEAGPIRETLKMFTGRVHTKGAARAKNHGKTSEAQAKVNERVAEERLRWKLDANFDPGDYHLALHYYSKGIGLEQGEKDRQEFLRLLRKEYRKRGVPWKYVACTETRWNTNTHHHIIIKAIDVAILTEVWERVVGQNNGSISIKPLDKRGNHAKMARYLMKETRRTAERYREVGKRYKRFSCAKGMVQPEPVYQVIRADNWAKEPRPRKGYVLLKDDNGATCRSGVHEVTGWPWQEYFELRVEPPGLPVKQKAPPRQRRRNKT